MALLRRRRLCLSAAFAVLLFAAALGTGFAAIAQASEETTRPKRSAFAVLLTRRRLVGSLPPSCRARCGRCFPCRPVQVAIQQAGRIVPEEYYPEAWRCECGSKLFMP
ncbi:EPIDERMAL PATTERNING FACTOR-like protein 5 [Zingiber officinale]|uniref:Epidermal patterning factor-like protein n=1 Tax=Zingiber officinale TaxID=94328 RepID=A0A8J5LL46_ZINOF|nr:EPIDERMAL PATTERNING FACTOR-like protein 5 [Zingiber officinale]KAG6516798.1 hypothetical protein ZIOFF_027278 [Zingiber officinale]